MAPVGGQKRRLMPLNRLGEGVAGDRGGGEASKLQGASGLRHVSARAKRIAAAGVPGAPVQAAQEPPMKQTALHVMRSFLPQRNTAEPRLVERQSPVVRRRARPSSPRLTLSPRSCDEAVILPGQRSPRRDLGVGMHNIGNSCYMSAILQCLANVDAFASLVVAEGEPCANEGEMAVLDSLKHELILLLNRIIPVERPPSDGFVSISPTSFHRAFTQAAPHFAGFQQHDAHEFLMALFSLMNEAWSTQQPSQSPDWNLAVDQTFYFQIKQRLECPSCHYTRSHDEGHYHISLDLPALERQTPQCALCSKNMLRRTVQKEGARHGSVYYKCFSCPDSYVYETTLEKDTRTNLGAFRIDTLVQSYMSTKTIQLRCEKCQCDDVGMTPSVKTMPHVLLFHLKRFSYDPSSKHYIKRQDRVQIPTEMNLGPFCCDEPQLANPNLEFESAAGTYKLKAIVQHSGSEIGSGHYTADIYNASRHEWITFNDSVLSQTSQHSVQERASTNGYLVFYEK